MTNKSFYAALAVMVMLLFTWPIPGTIALRNGLAGVFIIVLLMAAWQDRALQRISLPALHWPIGIFLTLTLWILLIIVGWAAEPSLSWKEFWGQWILPALLGVAGYLLARLGIARGEAGIRLLLKVMFFTLFTQVLLHDLIDLLYWLITDQLPFRQAPVLHLPGILTSLVTGDGWLENFDGKFGEKFSFVNNLFAGLVLAEIIQRLVFGKRVIAVSKALLGLSLLLLLVASYWLSYRNGNIGLVSLLMTAGFLILLRVRQLLNLQWVIGSGLVAVVLLVSMANMFWKSDPRWKSFAETIPIALDTDKNQAWLLNKIVPYPRLSNGEQVDPSNYERIAWIKEGLKLGWENPLGTGLNRNAFFDGLYRKLPIEGIERGGHSHSGVVDFFIANGLPGIVLWFLFLLSLAVLGWRAFKSGSIALGLILIFIVSGSFTRSLVDSNIRDHVLQQFMFLASVFASFCAFKIKVKDMGRQP